MRRVTRSLANATKKRAVPSTKSKKRALSSTSSAAAATTPKKKKKKKLPPLTPPGAIQKAAPKLAGDWIKTYNMIAELRQDRTAPVDVFGSEALPDRQTKDPMVGKAMGKLKQGLTPFSVEGVRSKSVEEIRDLIYGVGFHNNKAKYIVNSAAMIREEHNGHVPSTFHGLCSLPGVGPKMAMIVMDVAFNECLGVSIDTHLHRMLQQLKWVKNSKNPEDTRSQLESWLPREYWPNMNLVWVGLGQEIREDKVKLVLKAKESSDPTFAIHLLRVFGIDVNKICKKEGI